MTTRSRLPRLVTSSLSLLPVGALDVNTGEPAPNATLPTLDRLPADGAERTIGWHVTGCTDRCDQRPVRENPTRRTPRMVVCGLLLSHHLAPQFEALLIEPERHDPPEDNEVVSLSYADDAFAGATSLCVLTDAADNLRLLSELHPRCESSATLGQ